MSAVGVWVIAPVDDAEIAALKQRFPHAAAVYGQAPEPSAELAWWFETSTGDSFFLPSVGYPGSVIGTDSAYLLADLVYAGRNETDAVEELKDALMAGFPNDGDGLFATVTRKADPVAALFYGLGAELALQLPGCFGDFLLTADQVREVLPSVEAALGMSADHCSVVTVRIMDWLTGLGDATDCDAVELIRGPLRLLHDAATTGRGAVGLTRWY